MARLVPALTLLLTACAPTGAPPQPGEAALVTQPSMTFPVPVYLPENAAEWELEDAQRSLDAWTDAVGARVFELRIVRDLDATGCGIRWRWEDDLGEDGAGNEQLGYWANAPGECWSTLWVQRDQVGTGAAVHELGHALGLMAHSDDPTDVMCGALYDWLQPEIKPYAVDHVLGLMDG